MPVINPKVDAYIANAQPFAQPILTRIRAIVHKTCPGTEEKIKWGMPHFDYNGKILCSMASFKQHCSFGFWLDGHMKTLEVYRKNGIPENGGMGSFGKINSIKDLPPEKELMKCIKEAMELLDNGVTAKKIAVRKSAELPVPQALQKALSKNKLAKEVFEKFPPSHRKEYIEWITEAKTEETREKRIATTIEWVSEGRGRNWKYERK